MTLMSRCSLVLWVSLTALSGIPLGCARAPADKSAADASASDEPSAAEGTSGARGPDAPRITVGGKPIESITSEELVAAASTLGWKPPKDLPPGVAVMQRRDGGRESLTAVFDKSGARLNIMIVRAVPGEKPDEASSVASAQSTFDAYSAMGKPVTMNGESAIVVADMAIGVKGASKAELQTLFDALVKR